MHATSNSSDTREAAKYENLLDWSEEDLGMLQGSKWATPITITINTFIIIGI